MHKNLVLWHPGGVLFWAAGMKVRFSFCLARKGHEEIEELGSGPIKE